MPWARTGRRRGGRVGTGSVHDMAGVLTRRRAGTRPSLPNVPSRGLMRGRRRRAPPPGWCPASNACRCSIQQNTFRHEQRAPHDAHTTTATDLEREVFQGVRDTGLGLVPAARLDEDGDSGRGLAVVRRGDLHARGIDDGCVPACTAGDARRTARGRRSGCQHGGRIVRE